MSWLVALLRGVNLAGRNKVPMAELRRTASGLGLDDVSTYLASGNLLFRAPPDRVDGVARELEAAIAHEFGHDIRVLLRSRRDLETVAAANPFLTDDADSKKLHVVFLEEAPAEERAAKLDPERSPGDEFEVAGREIYAHYPGGFGRSKLSLDYFERTLGVVGTMRNWNTVTTLLDRMT